MYCIFPRRKTSHLWKKIALGAGFYEIMIFNNRVKIS